MARYLTKYVGTYRVKAMYDLSTNDFPRDEYGNIDPSFEDLYIPCRNKCMIKHAFKDNLSVYIPSIKRGHNLIKEITDKYGNDIIYDIDETDAEIIFLFKAVDVDKIADVLIATTSGNSISPFSKKNLPKAKYEMPEKDMDRYKEIVKDIPFEKIIKISNIYNAFDKEIQNKMGKTYDISFKRKLSALKNKEFIHSIGMWDEFIEFLEKEIKNI